MMDADLTRNAVPASPEREGACAASMVDLRVGREIRPDSVKAV